MATTKPAPAPARSESPISGGKIATWIVQGMFLSLGGLALAGIIGIVRSHRERRLQRDLEEGLEDDDFDDDEEF